MIITSPLKAIRAKCLECSNGSAADVRNCPIEQCELFPFRYGKNPYNRRTLTDEQKAEVLERFRKNRAKKGVEGDETDQCG